MQSVVTGQAPITVSFLLCSIYTEYYEALLGWNTRSRCADQICYPYVRLTLWKGECRWAFDCSDTVMVYILRILFFGSAHILLGRWIDTNDHMYIENLAVNKKQFPPFCQRFGGGVPLFVICPWFFWVSGFSTVSAPLATDFHQGGVLVYGRWGPYISYVRSLRTNILSILFRISGKCRMRRDYELILTRSSVYYIYQGTLHIMLQGRCKERFREHWRAAVEYTCPWYGYCLVIRWRHPPLWSLSPFSLLLLFLSLTLFFFVLIFRY